MYGSIKVPILKEVNFWAWLLLYSAITPKNEDKKCPKVFNVPEFHSSEVTFFQNWYFNTPLKRGFIRLFGFYAALYVNSRITGLENSIFDVTNRLLNTYVKKPGDGVLLNCLETFPEQLLFDTITPSTQEEREST